MSEQEFEDRPVADFVPEVADDDDPERDRYPEPEVAELPSDVGYLGSGAVGTTVAEQIEGESLDEKLSHERHDDALALPSERGLDSLREDGPADEDVYDGVGQLVAPDEGAHEDAEKDEVASEFLGDGAGSPEEQAMHLER